MREIVLDIETQNTFQEIGSANHALLKVSLVGVYDSADGSYRAYRENELARMWSVLEHADLVIGYNIKGFDFPVLNGYYAGDLMTLPTLDIMEEIQKHLGFRVKLDDVAAGTLGTGKSGSGLKAIEYFRNNQWDLLERYCLDDVRLTKELYDVGLARRELRVRDRSGREPLVVPVNFVRVPSISRTGINLTMPL